MQTLGRGVILLMLACAAGCNSSITCPNWLHPGFADEQRNRAQRFDPYPLPDVGPEVVGGRPLGFQKPATEPQRDQNQRTYYRRFGQLAPRSRY